MSRVSVRMLRYYDEVGLFKPAKIDEFTEYRYYSAKQIPQIKKIILFRDLGFNVSETRELMHTDNDIDLVEKLKAKQSQFVEKIRTAENAISQIDAIINSIEKENSFMHSDITIKEIPSYKVVSRRKIVESYSNEIELWAELGEFCLKNNLEPEDAPFAIYHDADYKEQDVDIEVAMPVSVLRDNQNKYVFRETENIPQAASLLYTGKYENIDDSFFYLSKWIEENGFRFCGKTRQVSIRGAWNEPNPDNYQVEIVMPVEKLENFD